MKVRHHPTPSNDLSKKTSIVPSRSSTIFPNLGVCMMLTTTTTVLLAAHQSNHSVEAFSGRYYRYGGNSAANGSFCRPPTPGEAAEFRRQRRQARKKYFVDKAFENLEQELRDAGGGGCYDGKDCRPGGSMPNMNMNMNMDPMQMMQDLDKQQEFIDRAFDLALDMGVVTNNEETKQFKDMIGKGFSFAKTFVDKKKQQQQQDKSSKYDDDDGSMTPPSQVYETDELLEISVDLPGVLKSNIELVLYGNDEDAEDGTKKEGEEQEKVLVVKGKRIIERFEAVSTSSGDTSTEDKVEEDTEAEDAAVQAKKLEEVPFSKSFTLDDENDTLELDKISASLENGVLVIQVPKTPKPQEEEDQAEEEDLEDDKPTGKRVPIA